MPKEVLGRGLSALIPEKIDRGDEELGRVLKKLDELLEKLPEDVLREFALSEDYEAYERVLKRYGV